MLLVISNLNISRSRGARPILTKGEFRSRPWLKIIFFFFFFFVCLSHFFDKILETSKNGEELKALSSSSVLQTPLEQKNFGKNPKGLPTRGAPQRPIRLLQLGNGYSYKNDIRTKLCVFLCRQKPSNKISEKLTLPPQNPLKLKFFLKKFGFGIFLRGSAHNFGVHE